jgi:eukaryotic-like serine/threonine-protein kinase
MEPVEGPSFADRIAAGPIPGDEALPLARQIADPFEATHEQGIIHRDLKPANIKLRPDGAVKCSTSDWRKLWTRSLSRVPRLRPSRRSRVPALMSGAGVPLGTAAYMSPEQARSKSVDKRADIWAFGCVLWEMLIGERLFRGDDITETVASVVKDEPGWKRVCRYLHTTAI